jgi:hypothetical protein
MKAFVIVAIVAVSRAASAHCICDLFNDPDGEAWAHYELTDVERVTDPPATESPDVASASRTTTGIANEVLAGFRLGGIIGGHHLGYHAEIDLLAGGSIDRGGFAYDVAFYPLGIGRRIGRTSFIALGTGIVATGATHWLDDGVGLPVQLTMELGAGRVRFLGRARVALLAGTHDDGAPSLPVGRELEGMMGLRIGHHYEDYGFPTGNGYFVGLAYKEMLGDRYVGLTIGYSMDAGTQRRHHRGVE